MRKKKVRKGAQKSLFGVATVVVVGKANAPVAETTENQVLTAAASTYQNRTPSTSPSTSLRKSRCRKMCMDTS